MRLDVSWNRIRDEIPAAGLTNLTRLVHLNMSNNNFYGSIPREMFQLKHLESLDLCYNYYLTGTIPQDIGNLKNLRYLSLAGNQITGGIPHGLSNLKGLKLLERLELQNNKLVGEIPVSLFNSSAALKALHLGGNQLTWNNKAVIKHSYMLEELSLRSCGLAGEIPEWISRQTSLTFLDLSVNSLHGILPISLAKINFNYLNLSNNMLNGSLPHIFQSNLTVPLEIYALLDLSSNQLTGEVPSSLGNLKGLKLLNLSNNHLSGTIPTSFGNLENVESLDLAHNELSGSIPESLTKLQQLKVFDVSNNRLTGKIPVGGKLGTMTNPDYYANNSGLCGMQIRKPCPEDASPQQQPKEQELSEELMSFFLPAAGIGYAVGLMVSVGVIYFPGS